MSDKAVSIEAVEEAEEVVAVTDRAVIDLATTISIGGARHNEATTTAIEVATEEIMEISQQVALLWIFLSDLNYYICILFYF